MKIKDLNKLLAEDVKTQKYFVTSERAPSPKRGTKMPEEQKKKISSTLTGRKIDPEHAAKIGKSVSSSLLHKKHVGEASGKHWKEKRLADPLLRVYWKALNNPLRSKAGVPKWAPTAKLYGLNLERLRQYANGKWADDFKEVT